MFGAGEDFNMAVSRLFVLLMLAIGLASCGERVKVKLGDPFTARCPLSRQDGKGLVRIFKDETEFKELGGATGFPRIYVANETELEPKYERLSNQYSSDLDANSFLTWKITSVGLGDAGPWGCEKIIGGKTETEREMVYLEVEGPVLDLYWTTKKPDTFLSTGDKGTKPPDTLEDGAFVVDKSAVHCVVIYTITAPEMHFTFGRYDEEGSKRIRTFSTNFSVSLVDDSDYTLYTLTNSIRFTISLGFMQYIEDEPLYCRASTESKALEKSVRLRVNVAPKKGAECSPSMKYVREGVANYNLSCIVNVFPLPKIQWNLPSGEQIGESSSLDGYQMENEVTDDGDYVSILRIEEVSTDDFGNYTLSVANKLGKGNLKLQLVDGDEPSHSLRNSPSILLLAFLGCLLSVLGSQF